MNKFRNIRRKLYVYNVDMFDIIRAEGSKLDFNNSRVDTI